MEMAWEVMNNEELKMNNGIDVIQLYLPPLFRNS